MKKQPKAYIFYLGIAAFIIGIVLERFLSETTSGLRYLPTALTGFGGGLVGVGVVMLIRIKQFKSNPEKAKEYEIAENDERNIRLREKSGYISWFVTMFVIVILAMVFLVLENEIACWLTLGALLIHIVSFFISLFVYGKKL